MNLIYVGFQYFWLSIVFKTARFAMMESPCPNPCPEKYDFYPMTSRCILVETDTFLTFNETVVSCRQSNSKIYEPGHPEELFWVKEKVGNHKAWIGITDVLEGTFLTYEKKINVASCVSTTDCSKMNFTADFINWKAGEPKNSQEAMYEDCLAFDKDGFSAHTCDSLHVKVCWTTMLDANECTYCSLPCPDQGFRVSPNREVCIIATMDDKLDGDAALSGCTTRGYSLWSPKSIDDIVFLGRMFEREKQDILWRFGIRNKNNLYYHEDGRLARFDPGKDGPLEVKGVGECLYLRVKGKSQIVVKTACDTVSNYLCFKKDIYYGEPCNATHPCAMHGNMRCIDKICKCDPDYTPGLTLCAKKNHRACVPAKFGEQKCEVDHCKPGLVCKRDGPNHYGLCKCDSQYKKDPGKEVDYECFKSKKLGEECTNDQECLAGDMWSECGDVAYKKLCVCNSSSYYYNNTCYKKIMNYVDCNISSQCARPTTCSSHRFEAMCTCPPNFFSIGKGNCQAGTRIGEKCGDDYECQVLTPWSVCGDVYYNFYPDFKMPTWDPKNEMNYVENTTTRDNQNYNDEWIAPTRSEKRVFEKGYFNSDKVCGCGTVYDYRGERCQFASLHPYLYRCIEDESCNKWVVHSYCNKRRRVCFCEVGYYILRKTQQCLPEKKYNDSCDGDYECGYRMTCNQGVRRCFCSNQFYYNNNECLLRKSLAEPCDYDLQCNSKAWASKCKNSKCVCDDFGVYDPEIGDCILPLVAEGYCDTKDRCSHLGTNYTCFYAKCTCEGGMYEEAKKCKMGKKIGEACWSTKECKVIARDTECVGSICMCVNEEKIAGPYTCTPTPTKYNCLLNVAFNINTPNTSNIEMILIRNYISMLFHNKFAIRIGESYVRTNMNYNDVDLKITLKIFLKDPIDDIGARLEILIKESPYTIANGDTIEVDGSTLNIITEKGYCTHVKVTTRRKPTLSIKKLILFGASVFFAVVLLVGVAIAIKKCSKYNPRSHMRWKYKLQVPNPYVPNKSELWLVLKLLKKLPLNVAMGKGNVKKMTKMYINYYYKEYYDFDFAFDYDYTYPYLRTIAPNILNDPYYSYATSTSFYPESGKSEEYTGLDSGYDDSYDYDKAKSYEKAYSNGYEKHSYSPSYDKSTSYEKASSYEKSLEREPYDGSYDK